MVITIPEYTNGLNNLKVTSDIPNLEYSTIAKLAYDTAILFKTKY